ncbi:hypothetical protein DYB30_004225 [Aphanomyces astaci]|uniref:Uncharacterized protein n=1 Tax=Aphanomyces astaci TaxID=112090 RepID=A0A397D6N7_APHAT|nr:hypothetical protein DYB30_004225 [Aphanomyces astaci]
MGLETGTVTPQVTGGRQCHVGSIDLAQAELPPPHVKEDACLVELHEHTPSDEKSSRSWRAEYMTAAAFVAVTLASYPYTGGIRSWHYVWWCGWLTAVSTGVGALPFLWVKDIDKFWLGVCNALAAGMMLAATSCLLYEGYLVKSHDRDVVSVNLRVFVGAFAGVAFIKVTKILLDGHEDVKLGGLDGI